MGLVITAKCDSEQVYLNTVATSIPAATENRQVGLVTVANAAGETVTTGSVVTAINSTAAGEEDTQVYTQSPGNSTESVDIKRGAQFLSPASVMSEKKTHGGPLTERTDIVSSVSLLRLHVGSPASVSLSIRVTFVLSARRKKNPFPSSFLFVQLRWLAPWPCPWGITSTCHFF